MIPKEKLPRIVARADLDHNASHIVNRRHVKYRCQGHRGYWVPAKILDDFTGKLEAKLVADAEMVLFLFLRALPESDELTDGQVLGQFASNQDTLETKWVPHPAGVRKGCRCNITELILSAPQDGKEYAVECPVCGELATTKRTPPRGRVQPQAPSDATETITPEAGE